MFPQSYNHKLPFQNISYGTIPYLGTFLTDLTMIDTAIPDTIADGLINFDKRRKEFEVLARIRLLQGAANAYNFSMDPVFDRWFHSVLVLDDREAYKLSCQIEPPPAGNTLNNRGKKKQVSVRLSPISGTYFQKVLKPFLIPSRKQKLCIV